MAATDNSVPVGIGVAGKSYVESFFEVDHACHRVHRRRIHPDLTVPINRHEPESRIDGVIHDLQIESVVVSNCIPVSHAGTTQWIDTDSNFALADCLKVDHGGKIAHIRIEVLMEMYVGSFPSNFERHSYNPAQLFGN